MEYFVLFERVAKKRGKLFLDIFPTPTSAGGGVEVLARPNEVVVVVDI